MSVGALEWTVPPRVPTEEEQMPAAPSESTVRERAVLEDLHRVLLRVSSGESVPDVLQAAAQGAVEALGFRAVAINLLTSRGDLEAVSVVGPPPGVLLGARYDRAAFLSELDSSDDGGLLRFVPVDRVAPDDSIARWCAEDAAAGAPREPDAWLPGDELYAPLRAPGGELLAILSLDQPADGRRPDVSGRRLVEMYAAQVGVTLSRAREAEQLREQVRLSRATHDVVRTAGEEVALDDVLRGSVEPLRAGFRAEQVWIRLFADEGGAWEALSFTGDGVDVAPAPAAAPGTSPSVDVERRRLAAQIAQTCWDRQRALVVSAHGGDTAADLLDPAGQVQVLAWLAEVGHDQFVLVPLGAGSRCVGYVVLSRLSRLSRGSDWTSAEEAAGLDLGRELGRVVATARARERQRELVRRLEESDTDRSETFRTVVHELKNPLAAILGNLEVAREDPRDVDIVSHSLEAIATSSQRMLSLVGDMLVLSELRESSTPPAPQLLDLAELVCDVAAQHAAVAHQGGVRLDTSGVGAALHVVGRREEVERMVVNLVSNAIKYSDPGDTVSLSLAPSPERGQAGEELVLTVSDTGIGIAEEDQQRIFADFERSADPAAGSRPGSGLGLAIAERVARRHGGIIAVRSTLGLGSSFTVRLPVASPEVTASGAS